ncbi:hypothetical protein [Pseudalkalibacillus salsuginis]|uniref:hypothetical protein n=1 Tax=Pseudalkalibacillus salsuginis TaxID=2910972 RepID=UPI001F24B98B|nr:hypothetical protein [Pseudalkalibacillus salsuginis]MCF6411417.1 hypothetical protein [Pseudalkalibacillus salsuginis]
MFWETLPSWFWACYYLFLLISLVATVYSLIQKRNKSLSVVAIVFVISTPLIGLINNMGRKVGDNELEHLITSMQQGSVWAFYVMIGSLFIFVWWLMFIKNNKRDKKPLLN